MDEILKKRGRELPDGLLAEWADKRNAAWTPLRAEADWRCSRGHRYRMSRQAREGGASCPKCPAIVVGLGAPTVAGGADVAPDDPKRRDPAAPIGPLDYTVGEDCGQCGGVHPPGQHTAALGGNFLVRDLRGQPSVLFGWERAELGKVGAAAETRHHVIVVDCSGSMGGEMVEVRSMLGRLLAVDEFRRPGMLVSLVSYSSSGDARLHLERVAVSEASSRVAFSKLEARGLTCVSGGLEEARSLLRPGERSVVTLHSDGYANDPSPSTERARVGKLVAELRAAGATVNAVAYRPSSDFQFLAGVANAGGGACVQAGSLREVYDALERAQRGAAGDAGRVRVSAEDALRSEYVLRVHRALRRVVLVVAGGLATECETDEEVYLVKRWGPNQLAAAMKASGSVPKRTNQSVEETNRSREENASIPVMLALARGLVGAGRTTLAKQVALSTGIVSLRDHARALTGEEVAEFASVLDHLIFGEPRPNAAGQAGMDGLYQKWLADRQPWLPQPEPVVTLPELLAVLAQHRGGLKAWVPGLMQSYKRRGLKRVPGKWVTDESGERRLIQPDYFAASRREGTGADGWCDLVSVEQNEAEATVNITLSQPIDLVLRAQSQSPSEQFGTLLSPVQKRVAEVAGVSLEDLRQYRSFTVVGDGEVCVKSLPCRVVSRALHGALVALGVVGSAFKPDERVDLDLDLPLLRGGGAVRCPRQGDVLRTLQLTVLQRLLSASLRGGAASPYSAEQVQALGACHVTPALYFSPPTCYPYADVKDAQRAGQVDSRVRYRVTFGTAGVLNADDLHSGNEFLQRRWRVEAPDHAVEKPTMDYFFDPDYSVREKTSDEVKRLKLGPVDALSMPLYAAALGEKRREDAPAHWEWGALGLTDVGDVPPGKWSNPEVRASVLGHVEDELELLRARQREVVMAVGASGSVPDEWGPALSVDQVEAAGYKVGKAERDGSFYLVDGVLASVFCRELLYSVSWESSSDA